tara:strand:+ start:1179 stop:2564 length:1386 start_codon:yes stop_codon:yes gene_type:complete
MNIKKFNRKIFALILTFPLLLNFVLNIFSGKVGVSFSKSGLLILISTILYTVFYFYLGYLISQTFSLDRVSYGLIIYFFSFFIIDNIFLFLTKYLSFKIVYLTINLIWISVFLLKKQPIKKILSLILMKITLFLYNFIFFEEIITKVKTEGDMKSMWLPWVEAISTNNYFYLLSTNTREGAGLLISHIQSTIFLDGFLLQTYKFVPSTTYFLFFFSLLFFYEIRISKFSKFFIIFIFSILIFNSEWLSYLFVNSLMGESILSLTFGILFVEVLKTNNSKNIDYRVITAFILLSQLYHSKFFINIIVFLIIFIIGYYKKQNIAVLLSLLTILLNELNYQFLLPNTSRSKLLSEIDFSILFNDINYENFVNIVAQFFTDKPLSYVVFIAFILFMNNLFTKNNGFSSNLTFFILFINFIFVVILYVFIWKDVEYESSYRYILNSFHLILFWLGINLDNYINYKK